MRHIPPHWVDMAVWLFIAITLVAGTVWIAMIWSPWQ